MYIYYLAPNIPNIEFISFFKSRAGGRSCGSPNDSPMNMSIDVKQDCPNHCIQNHPFTKDDVKINLLTGSLAIIKQGRIFKVILCLTNTSVWIPWVPCEIPTHLIN